MARFQSRSTGFIFSGSCRMTSPLQQKIKITGPSIVTANRTWDGVVIYRTASNGWSTDISDAAIVRTADEARALLAQSVAEDGGEIEPGNLREHIRLQGVTIDLPVPA